MKEAYGLPIEEELNAYPYVLIDRGQLPEDVYSHLALYPIVPAVLRSQEEITPAVFSLIDLDKSARDEFWQLSIRQAKKRMPFIGALLKSEQPVERIVNHLKRQLIQRNNNGSSFYLRLADPTVMRHLVWILDQQQLSGLFGPITEWCWSVNGHQWDTIKRSARSVESLFINDDQWLRIGRIAFLNECLMELDVLQPNIQQNKNLFMEVDAYLDRAERLPLENKNDQKLFVQQGVVDGYEYHEREAVKRCINKAIAGASYVKVCREENIRAGQVGAMLTKGERL